MSKKINLVPFEMYTVLSVFYLILSIKFSLFYWTNAHEFDMNTFDKFFFFPKSPFFVQRCAWRTDFENLLILTELNFFTKYLFTLKEHMVFNNQSAMMFNVRQHTVLQLCS